MDLPEHKAARQRQDKQRWTTPPFERTLVAALGAGMLFGEVLGIAGLPVGLVVGVALSYYVGKDADHA
jgi:hypothetical protein